MTASPQGTVFCRTGFLNALGVEYELWWVLEAGLPKVGAVLLIDENGEPRRAPFAFSLYHGVLFHGNLSTLPLHTLVQRRLELLEFLLGELRDRYGRISFCLHPAFPDVRAFTWFHYGEPERGRFRVEVSYTGRVDLTSVNDFDSYLTTIRKGRRYEYRRALKEGITVEEGDTGTLLELYRKTFARQGIDLENVVEQRVTSIADSAIGGGFGELLTARDAEGRAASAVLFLYDDRCGYYLIGANDPALRTSGSGTFVVLEGIRRCQARGLEGVDVCGMNSPNRGDFKASLNAAPVPYFVATWEGGKQEGPGCSVNV